jgi:hypothetical protein
METAPTAAVPIIVNTTRRDRFMGFIPEVKKSIFL